MFLAIILPAVFSPVYLGPPWSQTGELTAGKLPVPCPPLPLLMLWQRRMRAAWQRCRGVNKQRGGRRGEDEAQMNEESTQKRRYKKDRSRCGHIGRKGSSWEEWFWNRRGKEKPRWPARAWSQHPKSLPFLPCQSMPVSILLPLTV